jgi:hypothetical protein
MKQQKMARFFFNPGLWGQHEGVLLPRLLEFHCKSNFRMAPNPLEKKWKISWGQIQRVRLSHFVYLCIIVGKISDRNIRDRFKGKSKGRWDTFSFSISRIQHREGKSWKKKKNHFFSAPIQTKVEGSLGHLFFFLGSETMSGGCKSKVGFFHFLVEAVP